MNVGDVSTFGVQDTTVSTLTTKIEHKVSSLKNLSNRVQEIDRYLQNVFDGKLPSAHPKIVYLLQEIYNLSPNLQVEQLQKVRTVVCLPLRFLF